MKINIKEEWSSLPTEAENGKIVIVTRNEGLAEAAASGHYTFRVDVSMPYESLPDGMPTDAAASLLEEATDAFHATLAKDKAALLACIYTGDGRRDWIFYAHSLGVFRNILNRALSPLPLLPLEIEAYDDPQWQEWHLE